MAEWHEGLPAPVHTDDTPGAWVHRNIAVEHKPSPDCPCEPIHMTVDELARDGATERLNQLDALN